MRLQVHTNMGQYPLLIERGILARASEHLRLAGRRVCIVTDSGVPEQYVRTIEAQCERSVTFSFEQGEQNKTFDTLRTLLTFLLDHGFNRSDAIVAVGGGVVTDLAGFAAATYMRGIDFYNVPTTLLAAVDASVGGKTAVDLDGYKNMVGAFWQPKAVLIDPETLNTLPPRRISDGLSEVIKMALTSDAELFEQLEALPSLLSMSGNLPQKMDDIIARALNIKIAVVEQDEREGGLRRVLNFGHTLGHAIESCMGLGGLYHGECVALGMIPMCDPDVRVRLIPVLTKCGLPTEMSSLPDRDALIKAMMHDKKAQGDTIRTVFVPRVGKFEWKEDSASSLADALFGKESV